MAGRPLGRRRKPTSRKLDESRSLANSSRDEKASAGWLVPMELIWQRRPRSKDGHWPCCGGQEREMVMSPVPEDKATG